MGFTKKMQEQGGKPLGTLGTLIGKMMNIFHGGIHQWGLQHCMIEEDFVCLDIGCGGGNVVKAVAKKATRGKTYGLDHSVEMVNLSRKVNRSAIASEIVEINQGNVSALSYSDNQFDLITAFETIQFWPDLTKDLSEVKRVLKPTGILLIVNRYPPENSKWTDFLQLKNDTDYKQKLESSRFKSISIDKDSKKGWIKVIAGISSM